MSTSSPEVALGANLALDLAVLRTRGTISTYANDGGKPVELDVVQELLASLMQAK